MTPPLMTLEQAKARIAELEQDRQHEIEVSRLRAWLHRTDAQFAEYRRAVREQAREQRLQFWRVWTAAMAGMALGHWIFDAGWIAPAGMALLGLLCLWITPRAKSEEDRP